jgi:dUTPase
LAAAVRFEVTVVRRPELALDPGVTVLAYDQGEASEPFSVILHNRDRQPYTIAPRPRIARVVVVPVAVLRAFEEVRK